jgi:hypothetical protein
MIKNLSIGVLPQKDGQTYGFVCQFVQNVTYVTVYIINRYYGRKPQKFKVLLSPIQYFSELTAILQKQSLVLVLCQFPFSQLSKRYIS